MPVLEQWGDYQAELVRAAGWDWRERVGLEMQRLRMTPREQQAVWLLFAGRSAKEAAHELGISHRTMNNHLTTAQWKAAVDDRLQLVLRLLGIY